jgi:hypothetical protein
LISNVLGVGVGELKVGDRVEAIPLEVAVGVFVVYFQSAAEKTRDREGIK